MTVFGTWNSGHFEGLSRNQTSNLVTSFLDTCKARKHKFLCFQVPFLAGKEDIGKTRHNPPSARSASFTSILSNITFPRSPEVRLL